MTVKGCPLSHICRTELRAHSDQRINIPQARIDRPVDKRRASHPLPQAAFKLASFLGDSGLAQAFENGLELRQIGRVVTHRRPEGAGDGEGRIERETGLDCGRRLVKATKLREGGSQHKIWMRITSAGLDRPSKPHDRLVPGAELALRNARETLPGMGISIARTEAQGLTDVSSVSSARPTKILPSPMNAWALARFRSSANACSHWAMPSAARLVNISTYSNNLWARAWSGTDDKALLNFASAAA
jgi:hypothetical protein